MSQFKPTNHFRYKEVRTIYNSGCLNELVSISSVLQQLFVSESGANYEWRELPTVGFEAKDYLYRGDPELENVLQ